MVSARKGVIYLAGDADACKKVEGVVASFADTCLYFGEFGAASRVKLVNNLLVAVNIAVQKTDVAMKFPPQSQAHVVRRAVVRCGSTAPGPCTVELVPSAEVRSLE